jgi:hypothetical protein
MFNLINIPLNSDPESLVTNPSWISFFLSLGNGSQNSVVANVTWGNITGSLLNQADLSAILNALTPPSTTAIKKGNGLGGFSDAQAGVDYVSPSALTTHAALDTGVHNSGNGVLLSSSRLISYHGDTVFYHGDAVYI